MKESMSLFDQEVTFGEKAGACREKLKRLDLHGSERKRILPLCRLKHGEIWDDPIRGHRVGLLDATRSDDVRKLVANKSIKLSIDDPPYNIAVGNANTDALSRRTLSEYIQFSEQWVRHVAEVLAENAHL